MALILAPKKSKEMDDNLYLYQPEDWPWVWAVRNKSVLMWQNGLEDKEIHKVAQWQATPAPRPVLDDKLYISSQISMQNAEILSRMGVTHVLNMAGCSCVLPYEEYKKLGIEYKVIDAEDDEEYDLLHLHWEEAWAFMNHADTRKVVVNCGAGLNRSGLIVAAQVLLTDPKKTVLEVVKDLRRIRGNMALSNEYFQEQLIAFARLHDRLGPKPGTAGSVVQEVAPKESERTMTDPPNNFKELLGRLSA